MLPPGPRLLDGELTASVSTLVILMMSPVCDATKCEPAVAPHAPSSNTFSVYGYIPSATSAPELSLPSQSTVLVPVWAAVGVAAELQMVLTRLLDWSLMTSWTVLALVQLAPQ